MAITNAQFTEQAAENLKRGLSSEYDKTYSRLNFMGTVPDGSGNVWVDPLDPNLQSLLSGDIPYDVYVYKNDAITTISQNYYNTTSLWWLIVMFNGFVHPHMIPSGYSLKIPKLTYILSRVTSAKAKDSIKGKIVRV